MTAVSKKSRMVDAILCWFLGYIGAHKFYEGKIGMGILYIFTLGLFGIGVLVDFIMILVGAAKDSDGLPIIKWIDDTGASAGETVSDAGAVSSSKAIAEKTTVDTLKEYKALFDQGVLTEEEYNKKKAELLK